MAEDITHASLSEENFNDLVHGRIVELKLSDGSILMLALSDIGFDRMELCLDSAVDS